MNSPSTSLTTHDPRSCPIGWLADRIGMPDTADGIMSSGATSPLLHAMLLARGVAAARLTGLEGLDLVPLSALSQLCILTNTESQRDVRQVAGILGLGGSAVHAVPSDATGRMQPLALTKALDNLTRLGFVPMAIVAAAGTPTRGAIDPLLHVASIAHRFDAWLHVDASILGCVLATDRHRRRLAGLERADSISLDLRSIPWPKSPFDSALIVKDRSVLRHGKLNDDEPGLRCQHPDQRLNETGERLQPEHVSAQDAQGAPAAAADASIDRRLQLAGEAWALLAAYPDLEGFERPQFCTVLFRYAPPDLSAECLDAVNQRIHQTAAEEQQTHLGGAWMQGQFWLVLDVHHPTPTPPEYAHMFASVTAKGSELLTDALAGAYA